MIEREWRRGGRECECLKTTRSASKTKHGTELWATNKGIVVLYSNVLVVWALAFECFMAAFTQLCVAISVYNNSKCSFTCMPACLPACLPLFAFHVFEQSSSFIMQPLLSLCMFVSISTNTSRSRCICTLLFNLYTFYTHSIKDALLEIQIYWVFRWFAWNALPNEQWQWKEAKTEINFQAFHSRQKERRRGKRRGRRMLYWCLDVEARCKNSIKKSEKQIDQSACYK